MTDNSSLRDIIGQHFFKQTPAFFAMSYFSVYRDYLYPEGGTAVLMERMSDFINSQGVKITTGTRILQVDPEKQVVTDAYGKNYSYKKGV